MRPALREIPQFPHSGYFVHISWDYLIRHIEHESEVGLVLEPDYQRGHVWSEAQQIAYVEYGLMGGESGMVITTNCPGWMVDFRGPYELVDGLQRVSAVLRFLNNEIPAFGHKLADYRDKLSSMRPRFEWRVFSLPTRAEVLQLYLLMNSGGVVHSPKELQRVKRLLQKCLASPTGTSKQAG